YKVGLALGGWAASKGIAVRHLVVDEAAIALFRRHGALVVGREEDVSQVLYLVAVDALELDLDRLVRDEALERADAPQRIVRHGLVEEGDDFAEDRLVEAADGLGRGGQVRVVMRVKQLANGVHEHALAGALLAAHDQRDAQRRAGPLDRQRQEVHQILVARQVAVADDLLDVIQEARAADASSRRNFARDLARKWLER